MSSTDLIRRMYAAVRGGDYAAFADLCDPDIEWVQNEGFPYGGRNRGAAAVEANVFRRLRDYWDAWGFDIGEVIDAGDRVVVLGDYSGRHRETGKSMRAATAHVFDIRNGVIHRFRQYTDTAVVRDATL